MARKFEKISEKPVIPRLENVKEKAFRVAFGHPLTAGYEIRDMRQSDVTEFHRFLENTVYKELTISEVDRLFLRTRGKDAPPVKYRDIELIHYGKDRKPFRLFGYYNQDGYFVICRIDGRHRTNKE